MTDRTAFPTTITCFLALFVCAAPIANADERPATAMATTTRASAAAARPDNEFLRFVEDGKGGGTLETAVMTYRNADGVVVHLVAAVHVAEPAYYRGLSRTFDTYDALLYELVKPKDGLVPGSKAAGRPADVQVRGAAAIGGIQTVLRDVLKLDFQLEAINYDRPNFVHADLDTETFNRMQEERGESLFGLMLRSVVQEMRRQAAGQGAPAITVFDILAAMRSPDSTRQYKLLLARQFGQLEAQIQDLEGDEGSVLLSERNKAALKVLKRTIDQGKQNIGLFYGAAHMRGIEDVLVNEMGFRRTGIQWRVAWDMRAGGAAAPRRTTTKPTAR